MLLRLHSTFYINYFCNLFVISSSSSSYSSSFHLRTGFLRYCPIFLCTTVLLPYYQKGYNCNNHRRCLGFVFLSDNSEVGWVIRGYYISCLEIDMGLVKFSFLRVGQCFGIF